MSFLAGFAIFSMDLALLHCLALIVVGAAMSPYLKAVVGVLGVSKLFLVGAAYFMAISIYSLDGMYLFLGSGSALLVYVIFLIRGDAVSRREALC